MRAAAAPGGSDMVTGVCCPHHPSHSLDYHGALTLDRRVVSWRLGVEAHTHAIASLEYVRGHAPSASPRPAAVARRDRTDRARAASETLPRDPPCRLAETRHHRPNA